MTPDGGRCVLSSGSDEVPLEDATTLYLLGSGWTSEAEARAAGERFEAAILRTFAALRVGVDTGSRAPSGGGFTQAVIDRLEADHGVQVINERIGITVFPSEPEALFARSSGEIMRVVPQEQFDELFAEIFARSRSLLPGERLALELFNASFFQPAADTRLLTLVMAVEALSTPRPRSEAAIGHVRHLLQLTRENSSLTDKEKASLVGSLKWLLTDSVRQTALRVIDTHLADNDYADMSARRFFDRCYRFRSDLVHGVLPQPSHQEISHAAAYLEVMVSDLLMACLSTGEASAG